MTTVSIKPGWTHSVVAYGAAVAAEYAEACRLSDKDAEALVAYFKPRAHNPRVCLLPSGDSLSPLELAKHLERFIDRRDGNGSPMASEPLPKVIIDQHVLLEIACMTYLSPLYEVKAFLAAEQDPTGSAISVKHVCIAPRQLVAPLSVISDMHFSVVVPPLADKAGLTQNEMYSLLHGDVHTHVNSPAIPSHTDLQGVGGLVRGNWDDLKLDGIEWKQWWVGLITNRKGDLYAYLYDGQNRRVICDLAWEVGQTVADPVDWVKQRFAPLLLQMQQEVIGGSSCNPDGNEVIEWTPTEVTTQPTAKGSRLSRHRGVLIGIAAVLVVAIGIGLYLASGVWPQNGGNSVAVVPVKPVVDEVRVPVGSTPALVPEPVPTVRVEPPPVAVGLVSERETPVTPPAVAAVAPVEPAPQPPAPKEVKPAPSKPTPVVKPKLRPWQEEIVRQNKGIRKAERAPKELDLRAFEGIDPGKFREWTADQWKEWTLTASVVEQTTVPEVIRRALDEQDAARQAAVLCKWCTSDSPHSDCRKLTRKDVQWYCELAPDYRGRNYKPLQHLPAANSLAR